MTLSACAWCGSPAIETVRIVVERKEMELDLCREHQRELLAGARRAATTPSVPRSRNPQIASTPTPGAKER